MSSDDGVDIGAVYQRLTEVAQTVAGHDRKLLELTKDIAGLHEGLTRYHATVLGHDILSRARDPATGAPHRAPSQARSGHRL